MSEITPFDFNGAQVRVLTIDGEPWWVASDICAVLDIANPPDAVARLDGVDVGQADAHNSRGQMRPTNIVNESGLYELVIRSDKPAARPFRRWVTSEVLPAIRKTGRYEIAERALTDRERAVLLARQLVAADEEAQRLTGELHVATERIAIEAPKVAEYEAVIEKGDLLTLRDVAHACGTGQNRLAQKLRDAGILFYDQQGGMRVKQHPWQERGWALDRWERVPSGSRRVWVTYFTPAGLTEIRKRFA